MALRTDMWTLQARQVLMNGGIGAIKIGHIAAELGVTREAFYWHFTSLRALHEAMLQDWETENSIGYRSIIDPAARDGAREIRALNEMWVFEVGYNSAWDSAVRDWARNSTLAAAFVRRIDEERIDIIREMFIDMGDDDAAAIVRARIAYCQQVGYYTVGFEETREERLERFKLYVEFLGGRPNG